MDTLTVVMWNYVQMIIRLTVAQMKAPMLMPSRLQMKIPLRETQDRTSMLMSFLSTKLDYDY